MSDLSKTSWSAKRPTWKEMIMKALSETTGPDQQRAWLSSAGIRNGIIRFYDDQRAKDGWNLSPMIIELMKDGYIEKAFMPLSMRKVYGMKSKYIYRWTGKPYHSNFKKSDHFNREWQDPEHIDRAWNIYDLNKKLPRWYRRMML